MTDQEKQHDSVDALRSSVNAIVASSSRIADTLEREILYSKSILRTVGGLLEDALILLDSDRKIKVLNQAATKLFCAEEDVTLGRAVAEVLPSIFEALDDPMKREDVPIVQHDKTSFVDITVSRVMGPNCGDNCDTIVIARDVTMKRAREDRVLDLAAFQNQLVQSMPVPTFYVNAEGSHIRGSNSFYSLFDLTKQKALGLNVKDVIPEQYWHRLDTNLNSNDQFNCTIGDVQYVLYKGVIKEHNTVKGYVFNIVPDGCKEVTEEMYEFLTIFLNYFNRNHKPFCIVRLSDDSIVLSNDAFANYFGEDVKTICESKFGNYFSNNVFRNQQFMAELALSNECVTQLMIGTHFVDARVAGISIDGKTVSYALLTLI